MQACRRAFALQHSRNIAALAAQGERSWNNTSKAFNRLSPSATPTHQHSSMKACAPYRNIRSTAPSLGVMDNMRSAYDRALQGSESKRESKVFEAQMKFLTADKRIDANSFLELLQEMKMASGLGGVKEHLPWVRNNPATGEFKKQEEMLRAFTPAERANVFGIGISGLKRVARQADTDLLQVEGLVGQVKSMISIQKWMKKRKDSGERLPESSRELQDMLLRPGSGISRKAGKGQKINPGIKGGTTSRRKMS